MKTTIRLAAAAVFSVAATGTIHAQSACFLDGSAVAGPQTPRDIASATGTNKGSETFAPASTEMSLCNIHTHTNAEHKGPGFSLIASGEQGGFQCNDTAELTAAELEPLAETHSNFQGVKPGDTIEVHWVHTSCAATPGKGLGACIPDGCENPVLRVEAQAFLLVNDEDAQDFMAFAYAKNMVNGLPQPMSLPTDTGTPVSFLGSTTGDSYDDVTCSDPEVTWSVRPQCAKLSIASLLEWAEADEEFEEEHSHAVRPLVTAHDLLSPIN